VQVKATPQHGGLFMDAQLVKAITQAGGRNHSIPQGVLQTITLFDRLPCRLVGYPSTAKFRPVPIDVYASRFALPVSNKRQAYNITRGAGVHDEAGFALRKESPSHSVCLQTPIVRH